MKRASYFLFLFIFLFILWGCNDSGGREICRYWEGYISGTGAEKVKVTINFIGEELAKGSEKALKASKLIIRGENFTKYIEFKSDNGERLPKCWIFITQTSNPSYPYGIVTLSSDYKNIHGQIPDQDKLTTFYSENLM